ncbi:alpha/beta-hydrolase [Plenodomus tracheiphilus IPT5]|uniref:Alpha/beta-hydrolase n=1 Tax=Plenodomus tracheiphilus IPT5 TaxID=1408161 RepID=A0A6A7B8Z0_9PLEO|nr:alpha/beta-hydrolase [Plenodomus tracheiphilus IPT5]
MADQTPNEASSIVVTRRDDRSFLMSVVLFLVRRFRNQINKGDPKHEDGSPKLDPPPSKLNGYTLHERTVCDIRVYDYMLPNKPIQSPKRRLYYFAGGSWQEPPTGQHYTMCANIAREMPDTVLSVVSMPLAPNNPAPSSFPWCMRLYRALMAAADAAGEQVVLAGDSSGANIVLCLPLEALREDSEAGLDLKESPAPVAIMAISPSTDLTRENPEIKKMAHRDPLLTPEVIKGTATAWCGEWNPADKRISPLNNDISLLAKRGVKVHGITAGCDVLSPDGVRFRDRCAEEGVKGEWVHWENQMHCFVLMLPYGLQEAKDGVQWIIDTLKKE